MVPGSISEALITDSIAIKILNRNAILTGVGNELRLFTTRATADGFNTQDSTQRRTDIKLKGKVHGIELGTSVNADKLIVFGEREFLLIKWSQEQNDYHFQLLYRAQLTDWISAAKFLEDNEEYVILTSHSVSLRFEYSDEDCANFMEKCQLKQTSSCSDKSTLYCALLHGKHWDDLVVFGGNAFGELLIWQPTKSTALLGNNRHKSALLHRIQAHNGVVFSIHFNQSSKLLTTTSDDRSVKFWRVSLDVNGSDWSHAQLSSTVSAYGHVARVFQAKIIDYDNELYVVSVGEDSYFCIWKTNGELIFKRRQQFGAIIWNLEYENTTKTLFTVGSTGNLLAYNLEDILTNTSKNVYKLPRICDERAAECVSKVKLVSANLLIGVTNRNHLVFTDLSEKLADTKMWEVGHNLTAHKCTVLEVYDNLIAVCGYSNVTLLKYDTEATTFIELYDGAVLNGLIRFFKFVNAENFLICNQIGKCLLVKGTDMSLRFLVEIPQCKEPLPTAVLNLQNDGLLILSNRLGNILLFKFNQNSENYELIQTLRHPHGNLGATVLQLIKTTETMALVKSAGHDGALHMLCVNRKTATMKILSREIVPVTWTETIESAGETEMLLGFNDNHFVIWSKVHDFILQVPCGGGHRCWHYYIYTDSTNMRWIKLAFIKNNDVIIHKLKLNNVVKTTVQMPQRNSWHVKPCNALAIVENPIDQDLTIISVSDDNLIKISVYKPKSMILRQMQEVYSHISNIRALKVIEMSKCWCFIFSGGGRAQLCVTKLNLDTYQTEELLNYTLSHRTSNSHQYSLDPETRIMAIDVATVGKDAAFDIYMGCSDGFVRKFHLNSDLEILSQAEIFYGKCLLQIRLIKDMYVIIAAMDGILRIYDTELKHSFLDVMHHASGINACDISLDRHNNLLHVITGGDDQVVTYTILNVANTQNPEVLKTIHFANQHTAQVTAARITHKGDYAFTSSVDQKICKLNLSTLTMQTVTQGCIADVKGINLSTKNLGFLYGCGLQIYDFNCS